MILTDMHTHSLHSGDSSSPMREQVRAAIQKGLAGLCFTEHLDPDYPYEVTDLAPGTFELDYDAYRSDYLSVREEFRDRIGLFFGIELGLQSDIADKLQSYVKEHDQFDFVIGSTHICHHKDPYYPSFYEGRSVKDGLTEFFEGTYENIAAFSDFDACGHLDYAVRYAPGREDRYHYSDYMDIIDRILRLLLERGTALEINTSPLASGLRQPNPCADILRRYRELGGELITIGSDAHTPDRIGYSFDFAAGMLRDLGFRYYAVYKKREAVMLPL